MNTINQSGIDLIKSFESFSDKAYRCPAGVWTIGYGHTGNVRPTDTITKAAAEALLSKDLGRFSTGVCNAIGLAKTNENQFAAMVSLAYNIGLGAFRESSVLREHKAGNGTEAAHAFLLWNKANGKVLAGLSRRRNYEARLYLK